jgi:hypothetical protein
MLMGAIDEYFAAAVSVVALCVAVPLFLEVVSD